MGLRKPKSVAIVAMGQSHRDYVLSVALAGNRHAIADEVWAINHMGAAIQCDRIIAMDDFAWVGAEEYSGSKPYVDMLRKTTTPVYTSVLNPEFCPAGVEYPLENIINKFGYAYFNNSVAYAVALALYEDFKHIWFFGADFTYKDSHVSESGRGCVEFWIGMACARKVQVAVGSNCTLLDTNSAALYGYAPGTVVRRDESTGLFRVVKEPTECDPKP